MKVRNSGSGSGTKCEGIFWRCRKNSVINFVMYIPYTRVIFSPQIE